MNDKNNNIGESLESILTEDCFYNVLIDSIKHDIISKPNFIISLIIILISFPVIKEIGFSYDTIIRLSNIVKISKDFMISLFGIVFTGYALFQALAVGDLVERMLMNKGKNKSIFQEYNLFFFKTSISFLTIILIDFILLVVLENISVDFNLPIFTNQANNIIATILIIIYLFLNVYMILEVRCLLYNIYQAFNIKALNEGMKSLNNDS